MLLNGNIVYSGTAAHFTSWAFPSTRRLIRDECPVDDLLFYDPSFPTNSHNVQVVEVVFLQAPNTFGDWELQTMTDANWCQSRHRPRHG